MMKKYLRTYFVFMMSIVSFSCTEDFLEIDDPNSVIVGNFYSNETEVEQALNGIYGQLQGIIGSQFIFNELMTDNTTIHLNAQDRGQVDRIEAFETWTIASANVNIDQMYAGYYNSLHNINTTLARIKESDLQGTGKVNQYTGELLFLRAYYYYNLAHYFGPVILLTEPLESVEGSQTLTRSAEEDIYNQIIADLTEASTLLPEKQAYSGNDIGRVPKGAALTLLGKVFLTLGRYGEAITELDKVLGNYSLLPDYEDIFDPDNKNHAESIFEVQFLGGNNLGEHSGFAYTFAPLFSNGIITGFAAVGTGGFNMPTNDLINDYEPGDLRKDASLREGYTDNGTFVNIPYIIKYTHEHALPGRTDDNWPVLRYADVLLMLAEAINEQSGPTGQAYEYLNEVRNRAGLSSLSGLNTASFREAVFHERRIELAFENHRWFDVRRQYSNAELVSLLNSHGQDELDSPTINRSGVPFGGNDYDFEEYEILFPIPDSQISLQKESLQQNPGY